MRRRSTLVTSATLVVVAVACALAWWLLRSNPAAPEAAPAPTPTATSSTVDAPTLAPLPGPCDRPAAHPFTPLQISIKGVVDDAAVYGVPRDSRGVTGVLPESDKADFAWDLGGIRPGSKRGNVLLNTHTWPDGSALGNALLDGLDKGDEILLNGGADTLCYRVTKRIEVLASDGYPPYYREDGPPRVAIIVCSGTRTGPGQWTHRTIWFARPVR
ncbi:class F sortase [Nocardioides sp. MH1]|uniref:class F sortase n=1 Tax=Nocardioides sp. MH1 TaxID=3242490 RepID=UPI0035215A36